MSKAIKYSSTCSLLLLTYNIKVSYVCQPLYQLLFTKG